MKEPFLTGPGRANRGTRCTKEGRTRIGRDLERTVVGVEYAPSQKGFPVTSRYVGALARTVQKQGGMAPSPIVARTPGRV